MSIVLNPTLISNINQLFCIPTSISKLIVDQVIRSIISASDGINESLLARIIEIEVKETCDWRSAIKSLRFLIKYAVKSQYPPKTLSVFMTEKTMLLPQFTAYLCSKYEQLQNSKVEAPRQAKLQQISWAVYNLKQGRNKQNINKMYIKTYSRTLQNGEQQEKVVNYQLPQFRYLLAQVSEVSATMK